MRVELLMSGTEWRTTEGAQEIRKATSPDGELSFQIDMIRQIFGRIVQAINKTDHGKMKGSWHTSFPGGTI